MPRTSDKRERLIDAANTLIHRHGFHKTTLADIARESKVPLGNVYYYFKTKEEICDAVIEERKKELTTSLDVCCRAKGPKKALLNMVKSILDASDKMVETGCPHGKLCTELGGEIAGLSNSAEDCMRVLLEWSEGQFKALGYRDAKKTGFDFIARIQGIILVSSSLHDVKQMKTQLKALCDWIEALEDTSKDAQVVA